MGISLLYPWPRLVLTISHLSFTREASISYQAYTWPQQGLSPHGLVWGASWCNCQVPSENISIGVGKNGVTHSELAFSPLKWRQKSLKKLLMFSVPTKAFVPSIGEKAAYDNHPERRGSVFGRRYITVTHSVARGRGCFTLAFVSTFQPAEQRTESENDTYQLSWKESSQKSATWSFSLCLSLVMWPHMAIRKHGGEMIDVIMEAEKFQDLQSASWRPRRQQWSSNLSLKAKSLVCYNRIWLRKSQMQEMHRAGEVWWKGSEIPYPPPPSPHLHIAINLEALGVSFQSRVKYVFVTLLVSVYFHLCSFFSFLITQKDDESFDQSMAYDYHQS